MDWKLFLAGLFFIGMVNGQFQVQYTLGLYKSFAQVCADNNINFPYIGVKLRRPVNLSKQDRINKCAACLKKKFDDYDPIYKDLVDQIKPKLVGGQTGGSEEHKICLNFST